MFIMISLILPSSEGYCEPKTELGIHFYVIFILHIIVTIIILSLTTTWRAKLHRSILLDKGSGIQVTTHPKAISEALGLTLKLGPWNGKLSKQTKGKNINKRQY